MVFMRSAWLKLAFGCLVLSGCFGSHDAGAVVDGGPRDGGGMCFTLPAIVQSMRCEDDPRRGPLVSITTSPTRCCGSGTVTSTLNRSGSSFDVALEWEACDCCEACRCIGPTEEVEVLLGPLPPGRYTVQSGGSSCVLDLFEGPACRVTDVDEVRMPAVLFEDQPLVMTLLDRSASGCSCRPFARFNGREALLELCECCDACDCIDPGYEVGTASDPLPRGIHTISTSLGPRSLRVVARDECRALEPTGLRIVAPDPALISSGLTIYWAVVAGSERLCCVPPAPAVSEGLGPAGELSLSLSSCVQEDCECEGTEVAFEAWHPLVGLTRGTHVVRAGAFEQTITVP